MPRDPVTPERAKEMADTIVRLHGAANPTGQRRPLVYFLGMGNVDGVAYASAAVAFVPSLARTVIAQAERIRALEALLADIHGYHREDAGQEAHAAWHILTVDIPSAIEKAMPELAPRVSPLERGPDGDVPF